MSLPGITDTFDAQLLGEDLDEWIMSTCQTYGLGWDVYIKDRKFVFILYKDATGRTAKRQFTRCIFR